MVALSSPSGTATGFTLASTAVFVGMAFAALLLYAPRRRQTKEPDGHEESSASSNKEEEEEPSKEHVLQLRHKYFASSLSVSYANSGPLMIVKGQGCYLMDEQGVAYLDTRNNVAHCGHSHPRIVQAVQQQVARLNTNTRYLHPNMVHLAERLLQTMPTNNTGDSSSLQVVFFCNSGSEANDLALRLARAYSGGSENTIVVDRAYHGHTVGTLQVSPYKYEKGTEAIHGNEEQTCKQRFWKVPCPDTYRGKHRDPTTAGLKYAHYVQEACRHYTEKGESVRAFIVESGMSVAGVILPPTGYLKACADAVHQAGGLYIADEVQTGLGRLGTCTWAFEYTLGEDEGPARDEVVIPDIVTIGKPFGNGMPLAAVVTSRKVAQAFDDCGVEYFNTFGERLYRLFLSLSYYRCCYNRLYCDRSSFMLSYLFFFCFFETLQGNPVCAAAGLAVFDVLKDEGLQESARIVGSYLKLKFEQLQRRLQLIGDVRGAGLFLGVELVRDRQTLVPATMETSFICSVLKSKYKILTSIDGPHDNVIVIKPPMVFGKNEADIFVECFEKAATLDLRDAGDMKGMSRTPT